MCKVNLISIFIAVLLMTSSTVTADNNIGAYELIYQEQETGTDPYQVKFIVTDDYLRIEQLDDKSGYVIYDNKKRVVHSIAHQDKMVLIIPEYKYKKPDLNKLVNVDYYVIPDAPKISGKDIYSYQVVSLSEPKEKCMDILLAEGLLQDVRKTLTDYQKILVGQQSRLLEATPEEYRSGCFLSDQVFNEGDYYEKGLPIQEWHSNGKSRLLLSYKKVKVNPEIFHAEEGYQSYSLGGLTEAN